MSLLLVIIIAFMIGFVEWWLALRRTLALTRGERTLTFILVLVEGLLAWSVISSFLSVPAYPMEPSHDALAFLWNYIVAYRWKIAIAVFASFGGAVGSLMVDANNSKNAKKE